jgi:hypothetical protein
MALPPLSVKIGAETDGLTKGLTGAQASIAKFAKVGVAGVAAVGTAMIALTKASMSNIDVLAKQARSLGLTTSAFQKMSLVANEAGVETGKLSSMLGLMQRNIVELGQGTQAQVDAFGRLGLSMRDLQGLEPDAQFAKIADALNSITDPAEKTAAAMEVFGRSGREAINMLNGYGAAAANAEAFQRRFGIAVSQDVSNSVERANDAVGRLGMVMSGLGNTMAGAAAPAIEKTANALINFMGAVFGAKVQLDEFFASAAEAEAILGRDVYNALKGNAAAIVENSDALEELARIYGIVRGPINSTTDALSAFSDALRFAGMDDAADEMMDLVDQAEALDFQFKNNGISAGEFDEKMQGVISRADNLVLSLRSVSEVGYQGAIRNLGDLRTALVLAAQDAARLVATLPGAGGGQTAGTGLTVGDGNLLPPSLLAPTSSLRPRLPSVDAGMGSPAVRGGGGGGGQDPNELLREQLATRLQTLMEGLMTERESVANWYSEGQRLLDEARAAELLTEQQYADQKERLAKEHQDRLSRIRELGAAADLHTVLGAGAEILGAMGQTNKKALKVAKVFGTAQALISAYQGAAEALKLPFPANIAAAASVLAKGIGFVNAIKGVNESGGAVGASSGGGAVASAASSAPTAPQASQTLNFSVTSDPFGISDRLVRQIVGAINQSQRDGSTLIRATVS